MIAPPAEARPFSLRLRVPVGAVSCRRGWLIPGRSGWGEYSPLPGWGEVECAQALRSAREAADEPPPRLLRDGVSVNALVPRVHPDMAAELAIASGCGTVKIKIGDAGDELRVRTVREAVGPSTRLRLDANGAWDVELAARRLRAFAPLDIELVEDPVASLSDLAALRLISPIPIAAEMSVRTVDDARVLRRLDAADALVLKPQRIGGTRAALRAAEAAGVPAIASSALESSVGLATVLALAAALPDSPFAHGVGTALLLESDVTSDPLIPSAGMLRPRPVVPDLVLAPALGA